MNKEEAKEQAQIMLDWANGDLDESEIEYLNSCMTKWMPVPRSPSWAFEEIKYRRKPKPLEMWCVVTNNGNKKYNFETEKAAHQFCDTRYSRVAHLREVNE